MTNLGLWAPYVNEREMLSWYGMPSSITLECRTYRPNGHEMDSLSESAFAALHQRTVRFTNDSVKRFGTTFHVPEHFGAVEANGLSALDAYVQGSGRKLPTLVRQAFSLGLYAHDANHQGSTLRVDARHGLHMPQLGTKVSTEWVTAATVNQFMRQQGLPLPARLFQTYVILSTTHGGATPRGRQLKLPVPKPRTIWGAITKASDMCPPSKFEDWVRQTIAVNYGEVPASPAASTWPGFVDFSLGFAGHVQVCMDHMDAVAGFGLSANLGWRNRLSTLRSGVAELRNPKSRASAFARSEFARYNITLK